MALMATFLDRKSMMQRTSPPRSIFSSKNTSSMALITESWLLEISIAIIVVFVAYVNWVFAYWTRRNIHSPPTTFLLGNIKSVFTQQESIAAFVTNNYRYYKDLKHQHGGFFFLLAPVYFPIDPEIVKHIIQSDFNHFVDRGVYFNEKKDPMSAHLFSIEGQKWRTLRAKLSPTFTSGKMKMMFDTLIKCGDQLQIEMDKNVGKESINIKDILIRFTTDIIGNCAFGIECNSLEDPDTEFSRFGRLYFKETIADNLRMLCGFVFPKLMRFFGMTISKPRFSNFFMNVVKETVEYREKNNVHRKDFMHLLLQLKNRGQVMDDDSIMKEKSDKSEDCFTFNEIAAQAFVFFLAGFETSSTTMTFCLFELASNAEVQEKLREEVNEVLARHGSLTYDALMEMHYMEKVINETLRKYPPLPSLNRVCTKDYKVPGTDLVLEEGTKVILPVIGLQSDPEYYPDPEKFDPERFSEENKRTRHPYTFLPFGEGPRICIGLRFGMMQTKVGLSCLLKNYKFTISPKTEVPLKLDPTSFIVTSEGGIWLDYTKIC